MRLPASATPFYAPAHIKGGIVYASGAIGITGKGPNGPIFAGDTVKEQTKQVLENLGKVLDEAGTSWDKVHDCTTPLL